MASTSKRSSAVRTQNTFCPEGEVYKHGFFTKSPPLQLFGSQNSWKRRFFILSKSSKGNYILKYLKGQNIKGSIAVDQIINIEVGISNSEIMETVRKMFKCLPEQVMSISTGNRCYYLIGSSRQETEDWVTVISSICREAKRGGCCPQNQDLPNPEVRSRPSSLPVFLNSVDTTSFPESQSCQKENGSSEDKNRPSSDPGPHQAQCDSPRGVFPSLDKNLGKSEENLLSSDTDEDIKTDEEDYYQTPSNILAKCFQQCTTEVSKPDPTAESDGPVQEKPVQKNPVKDNIYMSMKSLRLLDESCQLMCRRDGVPSPPKCQDNSACPRDLEANRDLKFPESSTSQQPTLQRRKNSLPLSVVQLSKLLSQVTDETQLQNLDIFIPLADINSYLKLTEAAGQICISQWTGPCRLGCLFNHGDHIVAVNDLQPQNVEEAYFFISRSTRKEVKLTVCRIPHSDIFHAKGCSCS
ncbi:pleckstrin homology domain-containing family S member 1 isoform X1 [Aquila chrysaetos chrysaetos]|uniref:pleckstrin homology domain-containing family S member 1 isoform X1 n=1 Tax=Aquila chrysaetos chrysaetos TaxID=223781 RepID=UPI001176DEDC|nr:pleckstrin homology domain-containing family S member 1 isoform X1 [Aquila chrysaetos chrysaetos]XP_040983399.1 pleckstrin homology domain-containing family S member 1 isoform X1 [Aquila chrysaetos chrysaetos]